MINTTDYRNAPSGDGPHAGIWADKPHRLVYDLCREVERLTGQPSPANGGWSKEWPATPGRYWCYGYPFGPVREGSKPRLDLLEVLEGAPGDIIHIVRGNFPNKVNCGPVLFTPAVVPIIPDLV